MIILPAIDIKDGNCVRLVKGDYGTAHKVAESYMDTARSFEQAGSQWIHMVDLDGAKDASTANKEIFLDVAKNTRLKVEVGGGIRNLDTVEMYLSGGVSRVIIGSAAVKNPQLVKDAVKEYGDRIAVGIDAKNGYVATEGSGYKTALPPEVAVVIKKAYFLLENLWENYMQSGKVNPVAGIFLGKNNYGYQDKTEYVLTPNQQNDNDYSADEIRERYIASDQQKRLSASNSDEDTSD